MYKIEKVSFNNYNPNKSFNKGINNYNSKIQSMNFQSQKAVNLNKEIYSDFQSIYNISMDYSHSIDIPKSIWKKNSGPTSNPSIVITDENGNVLASKNPYDLREGASTTKVFVGYAAIKLLDPINDVIICTEYAENIPYIGKSDVVVGQKMSVIEAATKNFPMSSNVTTANIAIAIGKKYTNCKTDEEAYIKGMEIINEFIKQSGCINTYLPNSSGVNYDHISKTWLYDNGYATDKNGISANDLALITIEAMNDENFLNSYASNTNSINASLAKDKSIDGLFWIKSGTQGYNHSIYGFNKDGKRYYISFLGVNTEQDGGNYQEFAQDIYEWASEEIL